MWPFRKSYVQKREEKGLHKRVSLFIAATFNDTPLDMRRETEKDKKRMKQARERERHNKPRHFNHLGHLAFYVEKDGKKQRRQ